MAVKDVRQAPSARRRAVRPAPMRRRELGGLGARAGRERARARCAAGRGDGRPPRRGRARRAGAQVGAYGYMVKPFTPNDLLISVSGRCAAPGATRRDGGAEGIAPGDDRALCTAVEARDPQTAPHIKSVSAYCWHIAPDLGLARARCDLIRTASAMHDVGKIGIPDADPAQAGTPRRRRNARRWSDTRRSATRILDGSGAALLQLAAMSPSPTTRDSTGAATRAGSAATTSRSRPDRRRRGRLRRAHPGPGLPAALVGGEGGADHGRRTRLALRPIQ